MRKNIYLVNMRKLKRRIRKEGILVCSMTINPAGLCTLHPEEPGQTRLGIVPYRRRLFEKQYRAYLAYEDAQKKLYYYDLTIA